jgi:hypothetical protein
MGSSTKGMHIKDGRTVERQKPENAFLESAFFKDGDSRS